MHSSAGLHQVLANRCITAVLGKVFKGDSLIPDLARRKGTAQVNTTSIVIGAKLLTASEDGPVQPGGVKAGNRAADTVDEENGDTALAAGRHRIAGDAHPI